MIPLGRSVGASSLAAGADRDRLHAERQGDVGVGGGAVQVRPDPQPGVDGAQGAKQRGLFGEPSGGAATDLANARGQPGATGALVLGLERLLEAGGEPRHHLLDTAGRLRAEVHLGARQARNRIDARAAFDDSEVEGGALVSAGRPRPDPVAVLIDKERDRPAERVHRIGRTGIGPTVAARTGDGELEAAAGDGATGDAFDRRPVQDEECSDAAAEAGGAAQVAHSGEIAFGFLADVGDEQQGTVPAGAVQLAERAGQSQQGGESRAVVRHARTAEGAVAVHSDLLR